MALGCVTLTPEDSSSRRSELVDVSFSDDDDGDDDDGDDDGDDGSWRSSIATPAAAAATTALSACGSAEPSRLWRTIGGMVVRRWLSLLERGPPESSP